MGLAAVLQVLAGLAGVVFVTVFLTKLCLEVSEECEIETCTRRCRTSVGPTDRATAGRKIKRVRTQRQ